MDFYDAGPLKHLAINLFYGWGYNFYRYENQLRQDDQLVRAKAAWLLSQAHSAMCVIEGDYRREKLPPPSRAQPFPDAKAVAGAQAIERLAQAMTALVGRMHALPAPESDRMTQRVRGEADTLIKLGEWDERLVGQCELLRSNVDGQNGDWVLENITLLQGGLKAIEDTVMNRQAVLT